MEKRAEGLGVIPFFGVCVGYPFGWDPTAAASLSALSQPRRNHRACHVHSSAHHQPPSGVRTSSTPRPQLWWTANHCRPAEPTKPMDPDQGYRGLDQERGRRTHQPFSPPAARSGQQADRVTVSGLLLHSRGMKTVIY